MMISKRIGIYAAAAIALLAMSIPMTLTYSHAQGNGQVDQAQPGGRFQQGAGAGPRTFSGGAGNFQRPFGGGYGGGQATMAVDGNFLYILRGNQLYKVDKNSLRVVGQGELPMPPMPAGEGFGQGRNRTAQPPPAAGGGGTPPPPPRK